MREHSLAPLKPTEEGELDSFCYRSSLIPLFDEPISALDWDFNAMEA
jgi:hypothetical protein